MIGEFPRTVFFLRWLYFRAVAGSYFVPAVAEKIPFQIQMKNVISQRTDTISLGKHCGEPGIRALFIVKRQTLLYKTLQRYLVRKRIHIPEKVVSPTNQTFTASRREKVDENISLYTPIETLIYKRKSEEFGKFFNDPPNLSLTKL